MSILRKILFNIWYLGNPPWDTNQTTPEVMDFIAKNPPGRVLDMGCGTGTNVITLVQQGWQATGVDFVPKAIRSARKKADRAKISAEFLVGDVTKLQAINGQFDFILDIGCYHNLPAEGKEKYRANLDRLMVTRGFFLLYCFFKPDDSDSGSGLVEADLDAISEQLNLIHRIDSTERGSRKSAWLKFQKT